METLERRVRRELQARAEEAMTPDAPVAATVMAARARTVQRRKVVAATVALVAATTLGVAVTAETFFSPSETRPVGPAAPSGSTGDESPPQSPSTDQSADPSTGPSMNPSPSITLGKATPCREIPPIPQDREIDTTLLNEVGELRFAYSDPNAPGPNNEYTFVVRYREDRACAERDDLRELINHSLTTSGEPTLKDPS